LIRDSDDRHSSHDFGKDLIPHMIKKYHVFAQSFEQSCVGMGDDNVPYWRDVGTIDSYWEANMELTKVVPDLNMYDQDWPIWTHQEQLPPAKFVFDEDGRRGMAIDSLVSGGCIVSGSVVRRSLLFSDVRVNGYCTIEDSVLLPNVDVCRGVTLKRVHCGQELQGSGRPGSRGQSGRRPQTLPCHPERRDTDYSRDARAKDTSIPLIKIIRCQMARFPNR